MLPFLVVLAVLGADGLRSALRRHALGRIRVFAGIARRRASPLQAAYYTVDLYAAYPNRAAADFDTGEIAAITTARDVAGSHRIYLSNTLDQPYIEDFFAYLPPPPSHPETDDAAQGCRAGDGGGAPGFVYASHPATGDVLVLSEFDSSAPPPAAGRSLPASEGRQISRRLGAEAGDRERLPLRRLTQLPLLTLAARPDNRWNHD